MRVGTWNVNGLRARLPLLLRWLAERQPEVVGLQELKLSDEQFPAAELAAAGYHALSHGQKSWNGVAILSRSLPALRRRGLPDAEALGARFLSAEVPGLRFTTVYCPNGRSVDHDEFARKLDWLDALSRYFKEHQRQGGAEILCGDFNICPTALDTWNEEAFRGRIFHSDAERERFMRLLGHGFADLYRVAFPETRDYTWWDYRAGAFHRNQGLRIDFLLGNQALAGRVRSVEIDRAYRKKQEGLTASDHAPVLADIDLR
jgi:exodeoxyribonuclease-3